MATILIVDDRPGNRDLLVTILGYRKHILFQAGDGLEALQIARAERPDLIISDILMTSMDGFEFVRQLRADPVISQTKVIFYTAHYLKSDVQMLAHACGVTQVLLKPAEPTEIFAAVDAELGITPVPSSPPVSVSEFDREHLSILTTKLAAQADQLRYANDRMTALIELSQDLGSVKDVHRLIANFCNGARKIMMAKYAAIGIVQDDGVVQHYFTSGLDADTIANLGSPNSKAALVSPLLKSRSTTNVGDITGIQSTGLPANFPPVHTFLGTTISSMSKIYGWICFAEKIGTEQFTREDEKLALILGAQLGNEQALSLSEMRYRRLFESAKDGILILDAETARITDANPYIHELLGYDHAELLGKELWELGFFKDIKANKEAVRELQEKHYIRYDGLSLRTKNDRRIEVEFVSNMYNEDLHPVIQCNIRDITERHRAAAYLAQEDRLKDEFLAMLAHELRNPLTPIKSAAQLLRMDYVDHEIVSRSQEIIERQADHMIRLVDDLLDVSRLQSGKVRLQRATLDLAKIVSNAIDSCGQLILSHNHQITLNFQKEPSVFIDADPARITQIVSNLVVNAVKYTPNGGAIHVATATENGAAVVRVRDNGSGIDSSMLRCIFDMYTQVEQSLDRSQGGLGLGLKLVKELVLLHGGTVVALSDGLGKGSEFVIKLPLALASNVEPEIPEMPLIASICGRRILLVEDNADTRETMELLLRMSGHSIETAENGLQGVEKALEMLPDVALIDIGLPVLNGYEVAKAIRAGQGGEKIVLIALSGYGQIEDKILAFNAGFDDHLTKPADISNLLILLKDFEKYRRVSGAVQLAAAQ